MISSIRALALPFALALPLSLAACSPTVRDYGSGAGGASSSSGTGGTTSSTGGAGGTGGGPTVMCNKSGGVFDIMTTTDFGAGVALNDRILAVADPGQGRPMVHVVVGDHMGRTFVRTVFGNSSPLGNMLTIDGTTAPTLQFSGGWVSVPGAVLTLGGSRYDFGFGTLTIHVDPNQGVTPMWSASPSGMTPADCLQPNYIDRLEVVQDPMDPSGMRWVASCVFNMGAGESLWVGGTSAGFFQVGMGMKGDLLMSPKAYAYVNGNHFIGFSQDNGGASILAGPDSAIVPMLSPFTIEPNKLSVIMGAVPLATNDGIVVFAADFDSNFTMGALWGGAVPASDFGKLQLSPMSYLKSYGSFADISKVAGFTNPTFDDKHIVTAGGTLTKDAVNFDLLTRDGHALVFQKNVYSTTTSTILSAVAGPLGLTQVVVWIEQDGANPPNYTVRGQELVCTGG